MGGEEPGPRVADGQGADEVRFREGQEVREGGRQRREEGRGLVGDEGLVVVLEVVDRRVLRRGDVDAHGDGVYQFGEGGEVGKGGDAGAGAGVDFRDPGAEVRVGGDGGVRGVRGTEHAGDEAVERLPHEMHVLGVGVVVESLAF